MRGNLRHACLAVAVGSVLALGCAHEGTKPHYPSDPLLLSKRPVEGKVPESNRTQIATREPAAPEQLLATLPDNSIGPVLVPVDLPEIEVPEVPSPNEVNVSPVSRRRSATEE